MSQRDFVIAAHALGAPSQRLIVRHLLPNVAPTIIVMAALGDLGHAAARCGAELPRPRRAAADSELGPHDRRGDDLFSRRAVARDVSRPRNLLRGVGFQPPRLWRAAEARTMNSGDMSCGRDSRVCTLAPGAARSVDNFGFPPDAKVLRLASNDDVPILDPAAGYDTASWTYEQAIFDTLLRYGDADVELHPNVATSWESSPDGTDLHLSSAQRCALQQWACGNRCRFQIRHRARDRSRDPFEGDGILPGHRRRGGFRGASQAARRRHRDSGSVTR